MEGGDKIEISDPRNHYSTHYPVVENSDIKDDILKHPLSRKTRYFVDSAALLKVLKRK